MGQHPVFASLAWIRTVAIVCLAAVMTLIAPNLLTAAEIFRAGDGIWEISSRSLPDCPGLRYEPQCAVNEITGGCWRSQSLESLREQIDSHPERRVVFYVHGNWMPQPEARQRALVVYRRLVGCANASPVCFIAFSWPSERREGFARDVRAKKSRLDTDSYYLACSIQRLQLTQPAGFIGFSFGGAVLCGAHHMLAGGEICGFQLPMQPTINMPAINMPAIKMPAIKMPAQISLIAPAFDRQDLTSRGRYHLALDENDSVVNLYNSMDPILKRFRFFDRDSSPIAAGFSGLTEPRSDAPLAVDSTIAQYDCRCIGRTHAELDYLTCPAVNLAFENVLSQSSLHALWPKQAANHVTHRDQSVPQTASVE